MIIRRRSALTGIIRSIELPINEEQIKAFEQGELPATAFPNLTASQREFYMSGVTDEEWDNFRG
jgi:hypothetical protein